MIPSIIHQIWLGSNPISDTNTKYMNVAQTKASEYHLWTEENIWNEIGMSKSELATYWNVSEDNPYALSDIARILIVNKYGGFYVDVDIELFESVDKYADYDFVTITQNPIPIPMMASTMNAFFGSIPSSSILDELLGEMEAKKGTVIHWTKRVGYLMFREVINKYKGAQKVKILDFRLSKNLLNHHLQGNWRRMGGIVPGQ